jgi:hypothetical protein
MAYESRTPPKRQVHACNDVNNTSDITDLGDIILGESALWTADFATNGNDNSINTDLALCNDAITFDNIYHKTNTQIQIRTTVSTPLDPKKTSLLLLDIQNGFLERLPQDASRTVVDCAASAINIARQHKAHVTYIFGCIYAPWNHRYIMHKLIEFVTTARLAWCNVPV